MIPLDPDTRRRAELAIDWARRRGYDALEELHRAGLILTPAKEREIRVSAMRWLHRELVSWRPVELLRRKFHASHPTTPADMYACIAEFLEEHVEHERTQ